MELKTTFGNVARTACHLTVIKIYAVSCYSLGMSLMMNISALQVPSSQSNGHLLKSFISKNIAANQMSGHLVS